MKIAKLFLMILGSGCVSDTICFGDACESSTESIQGSQGQDDVMDSGGRKDDTGEAGERMECSFLAYDYYSPMENPLMLPQVPLFELGSVSPMFEVVMPDGLVFALTVRAPQGCGAIVLREFMVLATFPHTSPMDAGVVNAVIPDMGMLPWVEMSGPLDNVTYIFRHAEGLTIRDGESFDILVYATWQGADYVRMELNPVVEFEHRGVSYHVVSKQVPVVGYRTFINYR